MALSSTARGGGATSGSAATLNCVPTSNFTGGLAVLVIAYDNSGASGADPYSSIADPFGNQWVSRHNTLADPGAASAGTVLRIFTSDMAAGLITTGTNVAISVSTNVTARAWAFWQIDAASGSHAEYLATGTGATGTSTGPSVTTSSITVGDMVIGASANEYGTAQTLSTPDADTTNGTWSTNQYYEIGTTSSGQNITTQTKVQTTTNSTQTYNLTMGTSTDWAAGWISIDEVSGPWRRIQRAQAQAFIVKRQAVAQANARIQLSNLESFAQAQSLIQSETGLSIGIPSSLITTVYSTNTTYTTAADVGNTVSTSTIRAGQSFGSPNYGCYETFVEIPTNWIAPGAPIKTAIFNTWNATDNTATDFIAYIGVYDYSSGGVTTGDFQSRAGLAGLTPIASFDTTTGVSNRNLAFTSIGTGLIDALTTARDANQPLYLVMWSDRHESGTAPTVSEYLDLSASESLTFITASWGPAYNKSAQAQTSVAGPNHFDILVQSTSPTSWWKLEESSGTSITDSGSAALTSTAGGGTWIYREPGIHPTSKAMKMASGYGTYIDAGSNYQESGSATDMTVAFWVKNTAWSTTGYRELLGTSQTSGGWRIVHNGINDTLAMEVYTAGVDAIEGQSSRGFTNNLWYHIAIRFSAAAQGFQMYLNGQYISNEGGTDNWSWAGSIPITNPANFRIGRSTNPSEPAYGTITYEEVIVYNSLLTPLQIYQQYYAGANDKYYVQQYAQARVVIVSTALSLLEEMQSDSPSMLLRGNEPSGTTANDSSAGGANDGTLQTGASFGGTALVASDTSIILDGSTGHITVPTGAWIDRGDGAFTFAIVVARDVVENGELFQKGNTSGDAPRFGFDSGGTWVSGGQITGGVHTYSSVINNTSRHMYVLTYDGTLHKIYEDGSSIEDDSGDATYTNSTNALYIGSAIGGSTLNIDGRVGYIAYFPTAISAARIAMWWSAIDIEPPAAPSGQTKTAQAQAKIKSITTVVAQAQVKILSSSGTPMLTEMLADSPSMLLKLDESSGTTANDSSSGGIHDGTISSTVAVTWGASPLVGTDTSADFATDAVSAYVTVPDHADFDRADGAFTVAAVINLDTVDTTVLFNKGTNGIDFYVTSAGGVRLAVGGGATIAGVPPSTISAGTRYQIVTTYTGSTAEIYINGVAQSAFVSDSTFSNNASDVYIGGLPGGNDADGRIAYVAFFPTAIDATRIAAWYDAIDNVGTTSKYAQAQAQADIKQTYKVFAQAQSDIKSITWKVSQANAWIKDTNITVYSQAQSDIKAIAYKFAQSNAWIKDTDIVKASQANTWIKMVANEAFAQANARIKAIAVPVSAQANAWIVETNTVVAQANAWIKDTGISVVAQANARINSANISKFAQAQADIKATYPRGQTYLEKSISAGATHLWTLGETGSTATDSVGSKDGTYTGASLTKGVDGPPTISGSKGLTIPQADGNYVSFTDGSEMPSGNTDRTVSWWFKSSYTGRAVVIGWGAEVTSEQWVHLLNYNHDIEISTYNGDTGLNITGDTYDNTWHHIGIVYTELDYNFRTFYDGVDLGLTSLISARNTNTTSLRIGALYYANGFYFGGTLSNIAIFPTALDSTTVISLAAGDTGTSVGDSTPFGQAQAYIKINTSVSAQAQTSIKVITWKVSQANARLKGINISVVAQANTDIKAVSWIFAQSQARIKTTYKSVAQAQAKLNAYGLDSVAQAQAQIKRTYYASAQAQADVKQDYNVSAQGQADIKQDYTVSAQAQGYIVVRNNEVFAQAQSDIKQLYNVSAQSNAKIILSGLDACAQAQANIKQTYIQVAQANAYIKKANISAVAQAQVDLKQSYTQYAQAQADIKQVYTKQAQAQSYISVRNITVSAQAQTSIEQTYNQSAQAQAQIILSGRIVYAQSQTQIKQIYTQSSQAQARLIAFGVVRVAQAQTWIEGIIVQTAQAQARIYAFNVPQVAQTQARIKQTYSAAAQAQATIESAYSRVAQAQTSIKTTYSQVAQAQADIKQIYTVVSQAQTDIKQIYSAFAQANTRIILSNLESVAQAQVSIKTTYSYSAQAQAQIKQLYTQPAQAQTKLRAFNVSQVAQAQVWMAGSVIRTAQAQAKINAFGVTQFAQALADIKQVYAAVSQAQTDIKQVYVQVAQAQVSIKTTYAQFAQVNSDIKSYYTQVAQSNTDIKTSYTVSAQSQTAIKAITFRVAQAQADIKVTYVVVSQAQTWLKVTNNVTFAQAQASIKQFNAQFAQANAYIYSTGRGYAQAQAYIISGIKVYAQAQTSIKATYQAYAQANVWMAGAVISLAQAQAKINAFGVKAYAQANTDIKQVYVVVAQSQTAIKQSYSKTAQAQVAIRTSSTVFAQAQVWLKSTSQVVAQAQAYVYTINNKSAQAQADILVTTRAYSQAGTRIIAFNISKVAQAQALIGGMSVVHAQAQAKINAFGVTVQAQSQAQIRATYQSVAQAQTSIKNIYAVSANAQTDIKQLYYIVANSATSVKSITRSYANTQASIKQIGRAHSQAQTSVKTLYVAPAQAQALIGALSVAYAQAQAQIKGIAVKSYAQAQSNIKQSYNAYAQASVVIKSTSYQVAQAQTRVQLLQMVWAQAQTSILASYENYAQAQASVLQTYNKHANAQALITAGSTVVAQAQTSIKAEYQGYAQASVYITSGYRGVAQAQAYIMLADQVVVAQAQALIIKAAAFAQAQAFIEIKFFLQYLTIADRSLGLVLADRETVGEEVEDKTITLTLSDRNQITLTLSDINY